MDGDDEARAAALIMSGSDVWKRLGRTFENTYRSVSHPAFEKLVTVAEGKVVGICVMAIALPLIKGYIGALAVDAGWRGKGIGSRLLAAAEARIYSESPNVFLCVSSFNPEARRFYERAGYAAVGELLDYQIRGESEIFMRKTKGPWDEFGK